MDIPTIVTDRRRPRRWVAAHREPFAAMNSEPEAMEHFLCTLSRNESDELVERIVAGFEANGFGLWALELADAGGFIGFTSLSVPGFKGPLTPAMEVGWRQVRWA